MIFPTVIFHFSYRVRHRMCMSPCSLGASQVKVPFIEGQRNQVNTHKLAAESRACWDFLFVGFFFYSTEESFQ